MSALCQKRTNAPQQKVRLFDHLVGTRKQCRPYVRPDQNPASVGKCYACLDLDQLCPSTLTHTFIVTERTDDLARLCTEVVRKGEDFPTVWQTLLKGHPLVDGIPRSRMDGNRSVLEIRLITGEWLVFDGDAKRFSVG
jgi:hypothetical protein